MPKLSRLIRARVFGGVAAVSPVAGGITRLLRGLREGDQQTLFGGAALLAYGMLKRRGPQRELLVRHEVPLGSTVVIRHGNEGEFPQVQFYEHTDD